MHIVTVGEDDEDLPQMAASTYLARHGVSTDLNLLPATGGKAQDLIMGFARDRGAKLVVMGAYGRSRMREFLFGGVTRFFLTEPGAPALLLAH